LTSLTESKFTLTQDVDHKSLEHRIETGNSILRHSSNAVDAPTPK